VSIEDTLARVAQAIQEYVNAQDDATGALVDNALVVWEEVGFDGDGDATRRIRYMVPTDNFTLSGSLGLLEAAGAYLRRDVLGRDSGDG
jgi:hypothetical protein